MANPKPIIETNRIHLVLFGMQNRTFRPYFAATNKILVAVMVVPSFVYVRVSMPLTLKP
jgi:hypothetical protein